MNNQLLTTLMLAGAFLLLFAAAEAMYHLLRIRAELTRKTVHFGTGILTLLFPLLLKNHWLVLFLCASFFLILTMSLRYNYLRSINSVDRRSAGSLLYPLSVYLCYLIYEIKAYQYYYFYLPMLVLAISDPVAALTGTRWPYGRYKVGNGSKTVSGSVAFFTTASIVVFFLLIFFHNGTVSPYLLLLCTVLIGTATTVAEACSRNGFDNLTIPVTALASLVLT